MNKDSTSVAHVQYTYTYVYGSTKVLSYESTEVRKYGSTKVRKYNESTKVRQLTVRVHVLSYFRKYNVVPSKVHVYRRYDRLSGYLGTEVPSFGGTKVLSKLLSKVQRTRTVESIEHQAFESKVLSYESTSV
jgi:hypothetical protein